MVPFRVDGTSTIQDMCRLLWHGKATGEVDFDNYSVREFIHGFLDCVEGAAHIIY